LSETDGLLILFERLPHVLNCRSSGHYQQDSVLLWLLLSDMHSQRLGKLIA